MPVFAGRIHKKLKKNSPYHTDFHFFTAPKIKNQHGMACRGEKNVHTMQKNAITLSTLKFSVSLTLLLPT